MFQCSVSEFADYYGQDLMRQWNMYLFLLCGVVTQSFVGEFLSQISRMLSLFAFLPKKLFHIYSRISTCCFCSVILPVVFYEICYHLLITGRFTETVEQKSRVYLR